MTVHLFRSAVLFTLFASATLLPGLHATAAEAASRDDSRPKIGLALSGGGARGAAHIGVIRVLEEVRIPVDYIAGTSMGSIVGGLYAAGMSPEELQETLLAIDWNAAFRDKPLREDLSFRRKQDEDSFPISLQLGWRQKKLRMPRGLLQGQNLNAIFTALTLPVATVEDFDRLSIPFRAVGTDIETGDKFVIGEGSLARAMRASMSIPGAFAPVEIDGKLLVDGGIAANLPVDVVREMGADIVIAVDISTPLATREKLETAVGILGQLSTILTWRNTELQRASLTDKDILVVPPLGDLGSGDFAGAGRAVEIGEKEARGMASVLSRLSVSEEAFASHLAGRGRPDKAPPVIDFIRIESDHGFSEEIISSRLHVTEGEPLDFKRLNEDIEEVYGLGIFERVDTAVVEEGGRHGLVVSTVRKSWGPNYINFGLDMEGDVDGGSSFNFRIRYNMTELNRWGAEWRTDLQVGENPKLVTEFYQPVTAFSGYFIAPRLEVEEYTVLVYDDGDIAASNYRANRTGVGFDIGKEFGAWGELRLGVIREWGTAELQSGAPLRELALAFDLADDDESFDSGAYFLRFAYDTLDSVNFPRRGARWDAELRLAREHLGGDSSFDAAGGRFAWAHTRGYNTVILVGTGSTVYEGSAPIQDTLPLGGFLHLSGLTENQLRGQHQLFGEVIAYRQVAGRSPAPPRLPVYLGLSLEAGNVWQDESDISLDSFIPAGSVFLGFDTVLGPAYLAYGYAEGGRESWYFFLGRGF